MPEKHGRKQAKLTPEMEARKWQKGKSGNPAGRPKKEDCIADLLNMILRGKAPEKLVNKMKSVFVDSGPMTVREVILRAVCFKAMNGDMTAVNYISDRTEGRPKDIENSQQLDLKEFAEVLKGNYSHE